MLVDWPYLLCLFVCASSILLFDMSPDGWVQYCSMLLAASSRPKESHLFCVCFVDKGRVIALLIVSVVVLVCVTLKYQYRWTGRAKPSSFYVLGRHDVCSVPPDHARKLVALLDVG